MNEKARAFFRQPFRPKRLEPCFCGSKRQFRRCCGSLAPDRDPPHGLHVLPGFIDSDTAARWVAQLEDQPREPLGVISIDRSRDKRLQEAEDRSRVTDQVSAGPLRPDIDALVASACRGVIRSATDRELAWFEKPQVLRYGAGGRYGGHADSEIYIPERDLWAKSMDRDVSLLLYLNEDFQGGELVFERFNYRYRPRTGDLLFFPSDSRYAHEAMPVTFGLRYAIVSWAAQAGLPRVFPQPPPESVML